MANEFTLGQYAKLETNPIKRGVLMNMIRHAPILEILPFDDAPGLRAIKVLWNGLPSSGFRNLNEGYSNSTGDFTQVEESVYLLGLDMEFDRIFDNPKVQANAIVSPKVEMTLQASKSVAIKFMDYFINGDLATDPKGIEGLKKRVSNMPSRQTVSASGTTDILDPTASAANARKFLDKWEEAAHRAGDSVDAIWLNEALMLGYARVLRYTGVSGGPLFDTGKDMFEREIFTYKGAPFIDVGLKADQSTEIITLTEDPGDAGNDATSAYFCSFSEEQGIRGMQLEEPKVYDPLNGGEMEAAPATKLRMDWPVGLWAPGSHGFTRFKNIETPASWT